MVLGDAGALVVTDAMVELGLGVALFGGPAVPARGFMRIPGNALPLS